jgi:glutamate racemase
MIKDAIGILDMGMESFNILPILTKKFKHERFVYANDLPNQPYEGKNEPEILELVKVNVEKLLRENIKLLVVSSDVIIEHCLDYLLTLPIPVIDLVSTLIDYVNLKYEQKNIVLLAKNSILEANLYQKNFKYNHLYSCPSDELESIIRNRMTKTTKSFYTAKEILLPAIKKDVDVIVTSTPDLMLMKIEMGEYLKGSEITNIGEIIADKITEAEIKFNDKGRGKIQVLTKTSKKAFRTYLYGEKFPYRIKKAVKLELPVADTQA